jgi:hypothetical protein
VSDEQSRRVRSRGGARGIARPSCRCERQRPRKDPPAGRCQVLMNRCS